MATSTIVVTYTVATGQDAADTAEIVTSMTIDGTAYSAVTLALVQKAIRILDGAQKRLIADKAGIALTGSTWPTTVSAVGVPKQIT